MDALFEQERQHQYTGELLFSTTVELMSVVAVGLRVRLLTNLPRSQFSARKVVRVYRRRWSIENMFQRLESVLHSEVTSSGYPRAALLAFGVAVLAWNVLANIGGFRGASLAKGWRYLLFRQNKRM